MSVIIPTFNGASRISHCIDALLHQSTTNSFEILIVDDGSTDDTAGVVQQFPRVRLLRQQNAGPATARNLGAREAKGEIVLFTDDDCVPVSDWIESMIAPFRDPKVVGAKGIYRSKQRELAARFVQIEYEDRYRLMAMLPSIDFIDTYSAAFRRDNFLAMNGYDTSFPVACAEDIELSYRMSARGWVMLFAPDAIVYHTHPNSFGKYLKKKYKFAFWRVLAVRKNPAKAVKDSHTPQIMKLQLLFPPALLAAVLTDAIRRSALFSPIVLGAFLLSTIPFAARAFRKDPVVGILAPFVLIARAFAQFSGVGVGLIRARQKPIEVVSVRPA
ncbi:glycosyltransferase [Acidicapsa dinghuensis]|uniref:Glycosyltransferase n=1 Tax=Acidicapsa dinghuensis TaxID=2218256 RepID=A0ABW1EM43_9BACT